MIEEVAQYIQNEQLIPSKNIRVYAAVSGGADSVVLLDILFRLQERFFYNLEILHFNHQTRGQSSNDDACFVENLAQSYNLKIHLGKLENVTKNVTETYLREKRFQFFNKYLQKEQKNLLATGHHLDDNIETFIMRLAKGSRLKGLLSILPKRGQYIKPLLKQKKEDILTYVKEHGLEFRQDQTNLDNRIIRNKIRNEIIPYLQHELNQEIKINIEKSIEDLFEYHLLSEEVLQKAVAYSVRTTKTSLLLNRKRYRMYNPVIRRMLLEYCISSAYPLNYSLSKRKFINWDTFIHEASPGKKIEYKENGTALCERNSILFGEMPSERNERYLLSPGKEILIESKYRIRMNQVPAKKVCYSDKPNIEYIDGDKSSNNLSIRFWRKGDIFKPLGMGHHRKLSDFFIDLKLNIRAKKEVPLICRDDKIIWIAGYRLDDQFKITETTRTFYKLELQVFNHLHA
jgi:tRNA(Ile)-lysidine synthase